jgi:predicted ATP-grasp superfamily ATP-dependent carboligase
MPDLLLQRQGGMHTTLACVMGGLSIVRPLGRAGIPVACVVTSDAKERISLSRFVRRTVIVPDAETDAEGLLRALVDFGAALSTPPVLLVDTDPDMLFLSRNRDRLAKYFRFALPSSDLLEDLVDKRRFADLARRADLPTPETHVIAQGTATRDPRVRAWRRFPCIVKPGLRTHWFGSRFGPHVITSTQKALCVRSRAELDAMTPDLEAHPGDFILQPLIEGGEAQIVSYHAYVANAGVVADFTGRKVRTVPREYGFSSYVQITDDERVREVGRDVVTRVGFRGVIKLDFKEDTRDGGLYLLEANPRFNLWHHPGAVAGVNLPALYYNDLVYPGSVRPDEHHARPGVRWMWAFADLQEARATGELHALQWLRELAAADVVEDLCWHDPLPGVARLVGRLRQRVARAAAPRTGTSAAFEG